LRINASLDDDFRGGTPCSDRIDADVAIPAESVAALTDRDVQIHAPPFSMCLRGTSHSSQLPLIFQSMIKLMIQQLARDPSV
jgi:hypothetical protein